MSIRIRFALVAAMLCVVHAANAKPRRVVVLEFDGPRSLADTGRSSVMAMLGEQYDVVATKRWEAARAQATGHGPQQWQQAARQAGVDAVIEGWIQEEGRHHVLTVAVREAATGNEIDSVSVRLGNSGVTSEATHKLASELDEVFEWIDGDATAADAGAHLPDARTVRPMLGAHEDRQQLPEDDRDDHDDRDDRPVHHRRHHRVYDRDEARDDAREETRAPRPAAIEPAVLRTETKVAAAELLPADTNDLVKLFGPDTKEAAIVSDGKASHVARPTPRFLIGAGGYLASRGMTFDYDPNAKDGPPSYPAQSIKGLAVNAAVYPLPSQKVDGQLSGVGFSFALAHSVGSVLAAMDNTGFGDYTMDHTTWEGAVHYRWPIDIVAIDGQLNYGKDTHTIVDLPQSIEIPDTSVAYLGAGAHIDLSVTDRATIGFGARYMYVLDTGDISSQDWYGAGSAWGVTLDGDFVIPLPSSLFVRGALEYRRVTIDFEGSGILADKWGVWTAVDSSIGGTAQIGVQF